MPLDRDTVAHQLVQVEQTIERAGTKAGNKGYEAAMTALEMVSVLKAI